MIPRVFALLALCLTAGCNSTSLYQIRGTEKPWQPATPMTVEELEVNRDAQLNLEARSVEKFKDFELGVLEITDDGMVNPAQKQQVFDMVRPRLENKNALLMVFAHGWHHGPHVCDNNIACFRRVLERIATAPDMREQNVVVTGVYLGWRGESWRGFASTFSSWDRKAAAQHIGRTGGKEVLLELDAIYSEAKAKHRNHFMTMVTVGHSLGGGLIFSAMKGVATGDAAGIIPGSTMKQTYRVVRAEGDRVAATANNLKAIRARLGDLVVLVNPAIEAAEYRPFNADLPDTETRHFRPPIDKQLPYDPDQLPVLLAIGSEADWAVGKVFVLGQWVSALLNPKIALDRGKRIGIGHYEDHLTHRLYYPNRPREKSEPQCGCPYDFESMHADISDDPLVLDTREEQSFGDLKYSLIRKDPAKWDVRSPYLVVTASEGVLNEHNDIYNPVFVRFLSKFIRAYYSKATAIQRRTGDAAP